MQDTPDHTEILAAVTQLLRDEIMPLLSGRPNYQVRVAANALDLVGRQMALQDGFDREEHARLVKILGRGELSRALTVSAHAFSKSAEAAIVDAGGSVERIPLPFGGGRPPASGNQHMNR